MDDLDRQNAEIKTDVRDGFGIDKTAAKKVAQETNNSKPADHRLFIGILAIFAILYLGTQLFPQNASFRVTEREFGSNWPFKTHSEAEVACTKERFGSASGYSVQRPVVTVRLGKTTYGLNGAAIGVGNYPDHKALRKRDQFGFTTIGAGEISDWIERSVAACK